MRKFLTLAVSAFYLAAPFAILSPASAAKTQLYWYSKPSGGTVVCARTAGKSQCHFVK
jgi:hypothetical protein